MRVCARVGSECVGGSAGGRCAPTHPHVHLPAPAPTHTRTPASLTGHRAVKVHEGGEVLQLLTNNKAQRGQHGDAAVHDLRLAPALDVGGGGGLGEAGGVKPVCGEGRGWGECGVRAVGGGGV